MSVKLRLTLAALALFVVTFMLAGWFVLGQHRDAGENALEMNLFTRIGDVAALEQQSLTPNGPDGATITDSLAIILSPAGVVRHTTDVSGDAREILDLVELDAGPTTVQLSSFRQTEGTHRFHVLVSEISEGHVVIVGQSLVSVDSSVASLRRSLLLVGSLLALVATAITASLVNYVLAPVEAIGRQAAEIGLRDLDRRLPTSGRSDEFESLSLILNDMLSRLERSSQTQQQLVADMAHELRSPLTAIAIQLGVDLSHPDYADWPTTATSALGEALRLQRLIDNLLLLARLDNGVEHRAMQLVDLDEIVHSTVDRLATTGIRIDRSGVGAGLVRGDPIQLQRCVQNLLDNATRYATSKVMITLSENATTTALEIADDGPGISAADRERIFERFYRVDAGRSRDSGGSGLGLAIVSELVTANGGTVEATPVEPTGISITVYLPSEQANDS